jgi:hypothetical protein
MALPFGPYQGQDLTSYEEGNKFLPREFYSLGFPNTPPPSIADASTGITNTQAASPYKWPPQGGGGGGGGNPFGPDAITKDFDVRSWQELEGPNQHGKMGWVDDTVTGYQTPSGWKTAKDKNIFHAGMFKTDENRNIGDIEETEMDFSKLRNLSPINLIRTKLRNWQKNREIKKQEKIAQQKIDREQTIKDYSTWTSPSGRDHPGTGGIGSPESQQGAAPGQPGASKDWRAQGGRVGYRTAGPVFGHDEPSEPILDFMQDQNIPFSEQVEGEGGILEQLVAKYIEAGFPPDQAEEMAMQEFQQMSMASEQDQGIASLV